MQFVLPFTQHLPSTVALNPLRGPSTQLVSPLGIPRYENLSTATGVEAYPLERGCSTASCHSGVIPVPPGNVAKNNAFEASRAFFWWLSRLPKLPKRCLYVALYLVIYSLWTNFRDPLLPSCFAPIALFCFSFAGIY